MFLLPFVLDHTIKFLGTHERIPVKRDVLLCTTALTLIGTQFQVYLHCISIIDKQFVFTFSEMPAADRSKLCGRFPKVQAQQGSSMLRPYPWLHSKTRHYRIAHVLSDEYMLKAPNKAAKHGIECTKGTKHQRRTHAYRWPHFKPGH
eukprot:1155150-Pelagomonas_calceolata.AAC.21